MVLTQLVCEKILQWSIFCLNQAMKDLPGALNTNQESNKPSLPQCFIHAFPRRIFQAKYVLVCFTLDVALCNLWQVDFECSWYRTGGQTAEENSMLVHYFGTMGASTYPCSIQWHQQHSNCRLAQQGWPSFFVASTECRPSSVCFQVGVLLPAGVSVAQPNTAR